MTSLLILSGCQYGSATLWAPTSGSHSYDPGCDPDSLAPCADDFFFCTEDAAGNKECISRDPATPDDSGTWECEIIDGMLHCESDHLPSDSGSWSCWHDGSTVICETPAPGLGDDGSSEPWDCAYEDDHVVCESAGSGGTDDPNDDGVPDDGGDETPTDENLDGGDGDGDADHVPGDDAPGDGYGECDPWVETTVRFGRSGELVSLNRPGDTVDCTTVEVDISGYYAFYDDRIAESCRTQLDEVGFLTVTNSCSSSGLPREGNVDDWYVVRDVDNNATCSDVSECGDGMACRAGNAGFCCVPAEPVYMGTFFLRAGEANELCINHWCPIWNDRGLDDGYITDSCSGSINSIHVALDGSMRVCLDPTSDMDVCPGA